MLFRKYDKNDDTDNDTVIYSSVHKKSETTLYRLPLY